MSHRSSIVFADQTATEIARDEEKLAVIQREIRGLETELSYLDGYTEPQIVLRRAAIQGDLCALREDRDSLRRRLGRNWQARAEAGLKTEGGAE